MYRIFALLATLSVFSVAQASDVTNPTPCCTPTSSSVPTNGLYLPTTNTLGWSINSAAEMQLTASALSPAVSGGNALGTTALPWAGLNLSSGAVINFNNGNYTLSHDNTNSILNASSVIRIASNGAGNALDMVGQLSNGSSIHRFLSNNASSVYAQFIVTSVNSGQLTIQAGGSTAMLSMDSTGLTFSNALTFAPNLPADTAVADSTVCVASSGGKLLKGTGTLGICLGTSGRQFKTAFAPMKAGIDEIARLDLWNYRYLDGFGDSGERVQYGPTAQDVAKVLPDLVRYDAKGDAISYDIGAFVPIALHAIQQSKVEIDSLHSCQNSWKCRLFGIR